MTYYIAQDGWSFGSADNMVLIDDTRWTHDDYELVFEWNDRTRNEYAIYCRNNTPYLTPTEWEKQK
jgi:hypothetical protein